ncbi:tripartite tricarboxylate transporter TctB family protein [Hyphomicrobium sp. LHD-15]|uniref:tripartite tricarboxylate transporter TctB family protein n=1 Tax=Hyphomicrobium sp. LHD-15 TaxID=3072142 RepID=UPI00280DF85E|nr:tripartite tricarboxylate transporter TctB family protein [Hyphomicrobium sp. LHD-15]MDQ8697372.1 tripartite tricarboxylate transporter TctB family protein [Hyphomicrobium sp. LHD-15]
MPNKDTSSVSDVGETEAKSWVPTQDFVAGIALLALGGFALYQSAGLPTGSLSAVGPGLLPRGLAFGIVFMGVLIILLDFTRPGERLGIVHLRPPVFIFAALMAFALTIKPLGLLGAVPIAVGLAGFASTETQWREIVVLAAALTVACIVVFGYLLTLSIPVGPSGWPVAAFAAFWK